MDHAGQMRLGKVFRKALKTTESVRVSPIPAQVKQRTRERGPNSIGRGRGGRRRASARKSSRIPKRKGG